MRIKNLIPNIITSMNLLCGVVGVILSLDGHLEGGFCLMLAAAVCDFFDGFAARLLNATSPVGKELDSLSDVVSFGVLPAIMLYMVSGDGVRFMKFFPLLLAAFSAYRLAKFNLDERQTTSFIGLPTPANALFWGSLIVGAGDRLQQVSWSWMRAPTKKLAAIVPRQTSSESAVL